MITDTRPTGVKLHLLDIDSVIANANGQTGEHLEVSFGPYAVAEIGGHLYVVCSEGVGWEVTETDPLNLDLYRKLSGAISMIPAYQAKLGPDRVRELTTDTEVDLAEHIRRFGARLETNFWVWHRVLGEKVGA